MARLLSRNLAGEMVMEYLDKFDEATTPTTKAIHLLNALSLMYPSLKPVRVRPFEIYLLREDKEIIVRIRNKKELQRLIMDAQKTTLKLMRKAQMGFDVLPELVTLKLLVQQVLVEAVITADLAPPKI